MSVKTYINFNGNCSEAVNFYAEVFGSEKPQVMLFGDMPSKEGTPLTEKEKNLVLHAEVKIKDTSIMFSDILPGMSLVVGNNISLVINSSDIDEIKVIFNKLKVGGTVVMELQETFWSKCYGFVIDKFGIGWQFSYENK